jgi:hypothetical protein
VIDLDTRLERLAAEATRDAVPPEAAALARRGRRRRRRQLAGSALVVAAVVAAGLVLPARLTGRTGDPPRPATDVSGAGMLAGHWFGRTDVTVYLSQHATSAQRHAVRDRLEALDVVDQIYFESRSEAYDRLRQLYRAKPELFARIDPATLPESFRVRLGTPDRASCAA